MSRSGKSDLAKKIMSYFSSKKVLLIEQDEFVLDEASIPKIKDRIDWEHPESIDFEKIIETVKKQHEAHDLVIVEGLLAFSNSVLNELYNLRVCMEISKDTFMERRRKEMRWGIEPAWYWEHVWISFMKFGQPGPSPVLTISGETQVSKETFDKIVMAALS